MARDNGKRGSYRHASGSLAAKLGDKESDLLKYHDSPATNSPTDSIVTPLINPNLARAKIDEFQSPRIPSDGFFDSPSESLNDKFPIMAIPGTMPRRMATPMKALKADEPTWIQATIFGTLCSVAFFGFCFTMFTGIRDVVLYVVALVVELVAKFQGA